MEKIFFSVNAVTIISLLLAIIFTAGVVWRVEKKLDISYKFFLTAVVLLFGAEILDLYYSIDNQINIALIVKSLRMFFALFFLIGVLFMRNIVREMDGEE
jgi:hypothetical protein